MASGRRMPSEGKDRDVALGLRALVTAVGAARSAWQFRGLAAGRVHGPAGRSSDVRDGDWKSLLRLFSDVQRYGRYTRSRDNPPHGLLPEGWSRPPGAILGWDSSLSWGLALVTSGSIMYSPGGHSTRGE